MFTRGARGKARDFNWHNVIGVWCLVPLFIVVISRGADLVSVGQRPRLPRDGRGAAGRAAAADRGERARRRRGAAAGPQREGRGARAGRRPASRRPASAGLNGLLTRAAQQEPEWRTINVRLPESPRAPGGVRHRSRRRRPAAAALDADARSRRRGRELRDLCIPDAGPPAAQRDALRPHRRGAGPARADDCRHRDGRLRGAGVDRHRAGAAPRPGLARPPRQSRRGAPARAPQPESAVPLSTAALNRVEESQS